ncbi:uncharacterized protein BYT42DRAFT_565348 [Radiomyces spectabilis]|uniref:uncharacterized protein n=1 Tax=Radiomyces spectabilis TaxID=64574 RepID=UPI00221E657D|nr:uncharacterized protein BYT42DRAFT_565348 [Radiomyces spectabilis]KAI8381125.1 hypothetical protein BYT42DRAFT_565348 [Radiomyces spectabilis]
MYLRFLSYVALFTSFAAAFPIVPTTSSADTPSTVHVDTATSMNVLISSLGEYYETVVDLVMESVTDDILSAAPHTSMAIHQCTPQEDYPCRASHRPFVRNLHDHLNFMRSNLLASVQPLVEANLPSVVSVSSLVSVDEVVDDDTDTDIKPVSAKEMTQSLLALNHRMAKQLSLIVNAEEASEIIIKQSLPIRRFNGRSIRKARIRWYQGHSNQIQINKSSVVYEADAEQQESETVDESAYYYHARSHTTREAKALTAWLATWLKSVQVDLSREFDRRVQDAVHSLMESFLIDE